jgi:hypothetical protein
LTQNDEWGGNHFVRFNLAGVFEGLGLQN